MKNVAGFDVSRLLTGSLGTLGLILEVSLKVLPVPPGDASLRFEMPQDKALEAMNRWAGQPLPLVASCWQDGVLTLRLAGARAAVDAACAGSVAKSSPAPKRPCSGRRCANRPRLFSATDDQAPLWRLSLPSVAPPLELPVGDADRVGRRAALAARRCRCGAHARARRARRRPCHAVPRRRQVRPAACSRRCRRADGSAPPAQAELRSLRRVQSRPSVSGVF
jgi:hypothetical protein